MHRKTRMTPVGQIVTAIVLMVLAAILAISAILLGQAPAAAAAGITWQAKSVSMLASAAGNARPYWNGRNPAVWVGQDPMCEARFHGRHGWAKSYPAGHRFRVQCQPDGSVFAWNEVN